MKKIKLRRSLYIGLGGTGMNAILHTKKMFMETYGEVPPMIGFLSIDTDSGAPKSIPSKVGECSLLPSELFRSNIPSGLPFYERNKNRLTWMPEENVDSISSLDKGAGQIRTNGRIAIFIKYGEIKKKIEDALVDVRRDFTKNQKYAQPSDTKVDVHLIFSVCGGTGGGTFIDIAVMLRSLPESINILGYGILSDVFRVMDRGPKMKNVHSNSYASVLDLDYLMDKRTLEFDILGDKVSIKERLFNHFLLINNINNTGTNYKHINEITEMLSLPLYTYPGGIGDNVISAMDNIERNRDAKIFDVGDKRAWVETCGACEIVFNGRELADIYARKAAVRIIERMLNACEDANSIANGWIDSPEINIRENNDKDNLINQICDKTPKFFLSEVGIEQPLADIQTYYESVIPSDKDLTVKLENISKIVNSGLHNLVIGRINRGEGCVKTTLSVLEDILRQVNIFVGEMNEEIAELKDKELPVLENAVKVGVENLQNWHSKRNLIFKYNREIDDAQRDIKETTKNVAIAQIEIKRRDYANKIYTALKNKIDTELHKVNEIKNALIKSELGLLEQIDSIQNNIKKRSSVFQIDLSKKMEVTITGGDDNDKQIILKDFIDSLPTKNLYHLDNSEDVSVALLEYTEKLKATESFKNQTIDDVLRELSDDKLREVIETVTEKAKPLLTVDNDGYTVGKDLNKGRDTVGDFIDRIYMVGVPDETNSVFSSVENDESDEKDKKNKNDIFESIAKGTDEGRQTSIAYTSIGGTEKIIVYRLEGVLPAFAVAPLKSYKNDYEKMNLVPHFDNNIKDAMLTEGHSLYPKDKSEVDDLRFWVSGMIFGLIKFERGKYWYKDKVKGDPTDGYWVSMNKNTRTDAYDYFVKILPAIQKEFENSINDEIDNLGKSNWANKIADVKENYLTSDVYFQCEASFDTIRKGKGYADILDLIKKEKRFIDNLK